MFVTDDRRQADIEALWTGFFDNAPQGIVVMRVVRGERGRLRDLEWLAINPSAANILGADPGDYVGRPLRTHYPKHLDPRILRRLAAAVHADGHYEFEHALARPGSLDGSADGPADESGRRGGQVQRSPFAGVHGPRDQDELVRAKLEWYSVSVVPVGDRVVILFRSITDYKNVLRQAVELMNHDDLTGLPNRRHLKSRFWVLRKRRSAMAILYFDLNGFKQVNDVHGHEMGDRVLGVIGMRLKQNVRPDETVARIGGDEFAVLLADPEPGTIERVADRLSLAVEEPINFDGVVVRLSASVGAALYPEDANSFEALLSRADERMYENKRSMRGAGTSRG